MSIFKKRKWQNTPKKRGGGVLSTSTIKEVRQMPDNGTENVYAAAAIPAFRLICLFPNASIMRSAAVSSAETVT